MKFEIALDAPDADALERAAYAILRLAEQVRRGGPTTIGGRRLRSTAIHNEHTPAYKRELAEVAVSLTSPGRVAQVCRVTSQTVRHWRIGKTAVSDEYAAPLMRVIRDAGGEVPVEDLAELPSRSPIKLKALGELTSCAQPYLGGKAIIRTGWEAENARDAMVSALRLADSGEADAVRIGRRNAIKQLASRIGPRVTARELGVREPQIRAMASGVEPVTDEQWPTVARLAGQVVTALQAQCATDHT